MRTVIAIFVAGMLLLTGCKESDSVQVIRVIDSRNGNVLTIKREECFRISGNPITITVLPLSPEVIGAVLSQQSYFVSKAMDERELKPNASFFISSLYKSLNRGSLERVAQKILYYEFYGEVLP